MNKANSEKPTGDDNWKLSHKPTFSEVEDLADILCKDYKNIKFRRWYCLVINILGIQRISDIRAMYSDIENKALAGKLFSVRASQEAKQKVGLAQYQHLKSKYGKN